MRGPLLLLLFSAACDSGKGSHGASSKADDLSPRAKIELAQRDAYRVKLAADAYQIKHRKCPASLEAIVEDKLVKRLDPDPWDNPWRMTCDPDGSTTVVSNGPDGKPDTEDDVEAADPEVGSKR